MPFAYRLRSTVFNVTVPLIGCALVAWACAMSPPAEPTPSIDPSLPGLDASWDPSPQNPSETIPGSSSGTTSSSSSSSSGTSSSSNGGPTGKSNEDAGPDGGGTTIIPGATKPTQGEIVISEVMFDPSTTEPPSEWIEVHNVSAAAKLLGGLTIVDGGNRTHLIAGTVTVAPGAFVVLVRNTAAATAAKVPSAAIVYEYGAGLTDSVGVQLANGTTGAVFIKDGATTIAQADYGGWYTQSGGSSVQLKTMTYAAAAQGSNWCLSGTAWTTGADKGTPGAGSDCP